ncbi:putative C6 transcription factor [Xylariales sp. PMI_506]|nr:putative C6 transcription factor [Xylariales sp. PMI_506]
MEDHNLHTSQLHRRLLPRAAVSNQLRRERCSPQRPDRHRIQSRAVSVACTTCRQRKVKCTGERPTCAKCRQQQITCTYDTDSQNETRNSALKRRFAELNNKSNASDEIISLLRNRSQQDVTVILQRLRAGEEVAAIVKLVKDGDLLLQCTPQPDRRKRHQFPILPGMPTRLQTPENAYLRSLLYRRTFFDQHDPAAKDIGHISETQCTPYDIPFSAAQLIEPRIDKTRASNWTMVTSSDALVQTLLKAYFQYEFPYNTFFHKDLFVEDLVSGRRRFCSPLLVNAILASACHCMPSIPSRSEFWNPRNLEYQFLAEAKRLWEQEQWTNHIATVQAGLIISITCNFNGIDKVGSPYLTRSITMAQEMGIFHEDAGCAGRGGGYVTVYSTSAWGLFSWQAAQFFHFYQAPLLPEPPACQLPEPSDIGELWVMYPGIARPTPLHHGYVFTALCEFRRIINNVGDRSYGRGQDRGPIDFEEAMAYRQYLLDWHESLPRALEPDHIVSPAQLKLQTEEVSTSTKIDNKKNITLASTILSSSKISMESVLRLYYARHGFEHCDTMLLMPLHFVGFTALKDLASATDELTKPTLLSTVVLCAKGLRSQASNFYIAEAVFILLRDAMARDDVRHLRELPSIQDEDGRKSLVRDHVHSQYPINIISISADPETQRLDSLVRAFSEHKISDDRLSAAT